MLSFCLPPGYSFLYPSLLVTCNLFVFTFFIFVLSNNTVRCWAYPSRPSRFRSKHHRARVSSLSFERTSQISWLEF